MPFFKGYRTKYVHNAIVLKAKPSVIWREITNVGVEGFEFPWLFRLLGVPKPLSAEVIKEGVGGYRVAKFSNGAEFHQNILEWEVNKKYRFQFNATKNFRVGHFMNLSHGPFQILTGGYDLLDNKEGILLILSSNYELHGLLGTIMHIPFRWVVYAFQRHLLKGIALNLKQK